MAASGNPAKRAQQREEAARATSIAEWKRASKPAPLKLPSGFVALVRVPGLSKLLSEGLIADTLTPMAEAAVQRGKTGRSSEPTEADLVDLARDPQKIAQALDTFDKVLVYCVVEPRVTYYKDDDGVIIPEDERDPDVLYSDEVDLEDKMFIFNVTVGGTKDLEKFRQQFSETVDGIQSV